MATPEARKDGRSALVGVAVLALIVVAMWVTTVSQSGSITPVKTIKIAFANVHTLQVKDELRQYGRFIGRISAIDYQNDQAVVTAELITPGSPIYRNATAQVQSVSPLALKFVNLDPGTPDAGVLGPNETISSSKTTSSSELQDVLDVLDPNTRSAATSSVRELGSGLAGHGPNINEFVSASPDLLANLGRISDAVSSPEANLPNTLSSVDRLASRFHDRQDQISSLVGQADITLRSVSVDNSKPLSDTLDSAPSTLKQLRGALHDLDTPLADLQTTMTTLRPGAQAIGAAVPDVRGLLREGVPVLDKVPEVADKAEPAVEDLRKTFADARPLAPRAAEAVASLKQPLSVLVPYGPEIGQFFVRGHSFVSEGPAPGKRYARLNANVTPTAATGGVFRAQDLPTDDYPKPGQADKDRATNLVPTGMLPSGGGR